MTTIEVTESIRVQDYPDYWYTAENTHIDVGCDGITLSYYESQTSKGDVRINYMCFNKEVARELAKFILKHTEECPVN